MLRAGHILHCPVVRWQPLSIDLSLQALLPSWFLCQGVRDSSYSTILRMYHCNNCNVSTMCPKKLGSWPPNFGLQQHSVRNFFLGHPICSKHVWNIQIFSSNTTLHWADSLYSLEKKLALLSQVATTAARRHAWPATQDPNSRSSLESAFMFGLRVWKASDKTFCQHGHVSSGDHSGHVCHASWQADLHH